MAAAPASLTLFVACAGPASPSARVDASSLAALYRARGGQAVRPIGECRPAAMCIEGVAVANLFAAQADTARIHVDEAPDQCAHPFAPRGPGDDMPVIATISLPTYNVTEPPDIEAIGPVIDEAICKNFGDDDERVVAIRGISLIDHPGHTHDSLAEVITACGTDRYDPERIGPTDMHYASYSVELHVGHCVVSAIIPALTQEPVPDVPRQHVAIGVCQVGERLLCRPTGRPRRGATEDRPDHHLRPCPP
jgi:hypothetical protein